MALNPSSGWQWYKKLDISNSIANYQMKLRLYSGEGTDDPANGIVYCNNHCKNFPNDIRFGTTNNPSTATQLPQWIEEYSEGSLQDISYDSIIFACGNQGVAMDDEWFYTFADNSIMVTKISDGKCIKAAFQYDDSENIYTDYTDEINNDTQNDVDLLPARPALGDAFYFGLYNKFTAIGIKIDTAGSNITITWKYWNGSSWANLPNVTDDTNSFTTSGWKNVYWDRPTDWQQNTVNGVTAYWVKAEVTSVGASPTQPKAGFGCSGRYTGNDGAYTSHLSDGHVLSHGGTNYLYVAGCNYPDTPKTGAVYKYKTASDPNPLDFVGVVKDFSSESCPGYLAGVDKYEVNGTTYWWVSFDVADASASNPSRIWRYDYDPSDDTNWTNKTVYNLGYYHSGYNIQGFTWWEDDYGHKYIICPIHEGSSPTTIDVYKWNGSGFDNYAQYNYVESPNGDVSSQGVCRDFSGDNTYLYFASREGSPAAPILKGKMIQSKEHAIVWVKLPFPATDSIYLFVGNQNASQYSDGEATFIYYNDGTKTSGWVAIRGNPSISTDGDYLDVHCSTDDTVTIYDSDVLISEGVLLKTRFKQYGSDVNAHWVGFIDSSSHNDVYPYDSDKWNYWRFHSQKDGTSSYISISGLPDFYNFHIYETAWYNDGGTHTAKFWYDGTLKATKTDNIPTTDLYVGIQVLPPTSNGLKIDYIIVRKYADPEPSWSSFGSWEKIAPPPKKHPITHLDKGPHPRSRMTFYPRLSL